MTALYFIESNLDLEQFFYFVVTQASSEESILAAKDLTIFSSRFDQSHVTGVMTTNIPHKLSHLIAPFYRSLVRVVEAI